MRMFDRLLLLLSCAITLFIITIGTAPAADLSVNKAVAKDTATQVINWTGAYGDIVMGYGWKDQNSVISGQDKITSSWIASGLAPGVVNMRPDGGMIGGGVGYDLQFAPKWVAGVAADLSLTSIRGSGTGTGNALTRTEDEKISQFGTLRGRLGYLIGQPGAERLMLYVTGGGAWAKINSSITTNGQICTFNGITCMSGSNSETKWGWVLGGGAEYRLDQHWSLSAEALFAKLGSHDTPISGSVGYGRYATPISAIVSQDVNVGVIRAALAYRW